MGWDGLERGEERRGEEGSFALRYDTMRYDAILDDAMDIHTYIHTCTTYAFPGLEGGGVEWMVEWWCIERLDNTSS
jgi:hypothetical protein